MNDIQKIGVDSTVEVYGAKDYLLRGRRSGMCHVCEKRINIGEPVFVGADWNDGFYDIEICMECVEKIYTAMKNIAPFGQFGKEVEP
ncbi:MAG: hypothetical protein J7L32_05315 [Thermoplasmata archaeon]|nr:hypothetical protein [Thermoplasmata archaeon]